MTAKKKIIITVSALSIATVIAIASLIAVLVMNISVGSTKVSVGYIAYGVVAVEVSASATVTDIKDKETTVSFKNDDGDSILDINSIEPSGAFTNQSLGNNIKRAEFTFDFKNVSTVEDAVAHLSAIPSTIENYGVKYSYKYSTDSEFSDWSDTCNKVLLPHNDSANFGAQVKILIEIINEKESANLDGIFNWTISEPAVGITTLTIKDGITNNIIKTIPYEIGDMVYEPKYNTYNDKRFNGYFLEGTDEKVTYPRYIPGAEVFVAKYQDSTVPEANYILSAEESEYYVEGLLTDATHPSATLVIPDKHDGKPVTRVGGFYTTNISNTRVGHKSLISETTTITKAYIGNNVREVNAFAVYHGLSLEDGVVGVGNKYLTYVEFGRNTEIIGNDVITYCTNITSVGIYSKVREFGLSTDSAIYFVNDLKTLSESFVSQKTVVCLDDTNKAICFDGFGVETTNEIPNWSKVYYVAPGAFRKESFDATSYPIINATLRTGTIPSQLKNVPAGFLYSSTSVASVILPDSVEVIEDYAFYGCTNLRNFKFSNNLREIGDYAFYQATGITNYSQASYTMPKTLESIGDYAFYRISNLKMYFQEGLKTVGEHAFYVSLVQDSIVIPDSVTSVGKNAFAYCRAKTLYIGSGLTEISWGAFQSINWDGVNSYGPVTITFSPLSKITTIDTGGFMHSRVTHIYNLPNTLETLNESAFFNCSMLEEINLPNGVKTIGLGAFNACSSLKEVTIPPSVTKILNNAFKDCTSLEVVNYNATNVSDLAMNNTAFYNAGRAVVYSNYDNTKYTGTHYDDGTWEQGVYQSGGFVLNVGKNVTKIPSYLFCPSGFNDDGLRDDNYRGLYSPKLVEVKFESGSSCIRINGYAFYWCKDLQKVNLPNGLNYISSYAFGDTGLKEVTIPGTIHETGMAACTFRRCKKLTSVVIQQGTIESTGNQSFNLCKNLVSVTLPRNLKTIGELAFGSTALEKIEIPEGVTTISYLAFGYCKSLTHVTIPSTVTTIGSYVFHQTVNMREIRYNAKNANIVLRENSSNNYIFVDCGEESKDVRVSIGASVESIPAYLFCPVIDYNSRPYITVVSFEEGSNCTTIGEWAFAYLRELRSVNIPENVTSIGTAAFLYCDSLEDVTYNATYINAFDINNRIFEYAGKNAIFDSNGNYVRGGIVLTIGPNVRKIPNYFMAPYSHTYDEESDKNVVDEAYTGGLSPSVIKVRFKEGSAFESIGHYAFAWCVDLYSIEIPQTTIGIRDYAFRDTAIKTITIPSNVTILGVYIFANCEKLQYAKLDEGLTTVAHGMFSKCTNLAEVDLPSTLTEISKFGLYKTGLITLDIPEGVVSVGTQALQACYSLTHLTIPSTLTTVSDRSFSSLHALQELRYNARNITTELTVNNYVFYKCGYESNGVKIIIGNQVETLPAYIFSPYGSSADEHLFRITEVEFQENSVCTSIGDYAFRYASQLKKINIPASVQTIGYYAFANCTGLDDSDASVVFEEPSTWIYSTTVDGNNGTITFTTNAAANGVTLYNNRTYYLRKSS